jgi:hypothetical protein
MKILASRYPTWLRVVVQHTTFDIRAPLDYTNLALRAPLKVNWRVLGKLIHRIGAQADDPARIQVRLPLSVFNETWLAAKQTVPQKRDLPPALWKPRQHLE